MGFPSPAQDYVEQRISLDKRIITRPAATYFMRAGATHYREGILSGVLLVVDASLIPCDGSLLVCTDEGEFRIKRYRTHPQPHWKTWRMVGNSETSHISDSSNISSSMRFSFSRSLLLASLFRPFACIGFTFTSASGKIWCTRFFNSASMISLAPSSPSTLRLS